MKEWITGRNPVYEVLRAGRRHLFQAKIASGVEEKGRLLDILHLLKQQKIQTQRVPRQQLDQLGQNHQGVALQTSGYPYSTLNDIFERVDGSGQDALLLLLDELQDPQNLGTLLRTAETAGVQGVLIPPHRSAGVTPAVVNASSGASEHLLIATSNLAQGIKEIKERDIWVIGLESSTDALPINKIRLDGRLALVIGSEGKGIRSLVRKSCDQLTYLPMAGKIESLNAAVAGSIGLYLAVMTRKSLQ